MRKDCKRFVAAFLFLAVGSGLMALAGASAERQEANAPPGSAVTTEPAPPLALNVRLVNLEKNSEGGIATILTEAESAVDLDEVTLKMNLPAGVFFTDGTRARTWSLAVPADGTSSVTVDLLVGVDGKYVISVEAAGAYQRKPIHRGSAFNLLVGVTEKSLKVKNGAVEYPAVSGGGD